MLKKKFSRFDWNYLILLLGLLPYTPLINSYFVLDEWHTFLYYLELSKNNYFDVIKTFLIPQAGQYLPITQTIVYSLFLLSKLNYIVYFLIGILLHFITAVLLYKLLVYVSRSKKISLLGSLFFIFSPQHFQGTSWVIANIGYFLSSIFLLLSLISYLKSFDDKSKQVILLKLFTSIFLSLSLLAKDIGLFAITAIPLIGLIKKRKFSNFINSLFIVLPSALLVIGKYLVIRNNPQIDFSVQAGGGILSIITLPLRSLVQSLLPQDIIYFLSKYMLIIFTSATSLDIKTTAFNQKIESQGALFVVLFFVLMLFLVGKQIYYKNVSIFKNYLIGIIIAALSGLSYFFVDSLNFSLLAPRYTYFAVIGIVISITAVLVINWKYGGIFYILLIAYMVFLFTSTLSMSIGVAKDNILRKKILNSVDLSIATHQNNLVLLVESDISYYGLPENIKTVPFQASPALVFAAYLNNKTHLPPILSEYNTFQKFDSQGYVFDDRGGYGYYWNYEELKKDMQKYKFKKEYVYAFKYFSDDQQVVDQTDKTRNELFKN